MIVSFSGNDGSGKTTICNHLIDRLTAQDIEVEYRHEYDYVFIKYLFKLFGNSYIKKKRVQFIKSEDQTGKPAKRSRVIDFVWPYVVWVDNILTIFYYKVFYRDKIIVLDRYPYDMYMSFEYLGKANALIKTLFYSIPKADVQIVFFAEPQVAMDRKKDTHDYDLNFYTTQLARYRKLSKDKNIEMYNTEEPLATTISYVTQKVLRHSRN